VDAQGLDLGLLEPSCPSASPASPVRQRAQWSVVGRAPAIPSGAEFFKFGANFETDHLFSEARGTAGAIPSLQPMKASEWAQTDISRLHHPRRPCLVCAVIAM
jgi:hypothetical protein